jgi:aminopeptidase N
MNSGSKALEQFHAMFANEALVLDKWFALQASACERQVPVLTKVKQLTQHADFHIKNPNRARSLIFSYCMSNPGAFHQKQTLLAMFFGQKKFSSSMPSTLKLQQDWPER